MQKSLPLLTVIVCLAVVGIAHGQPRPVDSTPSDYVPQAVQELPSPEILPSMPPGGANFPVQPPAADGWPEPEPEISPNAEKWRYVWFGGRWWYRQPTNRWSYWTEGRWVDYVPPARGNTPPYVQPPPPVRRRWRVGAAAPYYRNPSAPGAAVPYGGAPNPAGYY